MKVLRATLYAGAAIWAGSGLALAIAPGFLLHDLLGGRSLEDWSLVRVLGVTALGLAMLMVLVAQRLEDVWWWSWAFILTTAGVATVSGLHAILADASGDALGGWLIAAANAALCAGLILGMGRTAQERPFA